eukprot:6214827-Pleurochrysis_carterae.AAC.10
MATHAGRPSTPRRYRSRCRSAPALSLKHLLYLVIDNRRFDPQATDAPPYMVQNSSQSLSERQPSRSPSMQ